MRQLILVACLAVGIAAAGFAGTQTTKGYSLTIQLAGTHDPVSTVCTLVRTSERFEVALTNGKTQTILLGNATTRKERGVQGGTGSFVGP